MRKVFYSFHYDKDVMRVSQVKQMGKLTGDEPVSPNKWEEIKRNGDNSIREWIDNSLNSCSCLVVLIGEETANRRWVKYEIERAWQLNKGVVGIYIHNLKDPKNGCCKKGENPFEKIFVSEGFYGKKLLSEIVRCYDPLSIYAYMDIQNNIEKLVEEAIVIRSRHS